MNDEYESKLEAYSRLQRIAAGFELNGAWDAAKAVREQQRDIRISVPEFEWRYLSWQETRKLKGPSDGA